MATQSIVKINNQELIIQYLIEHGETSRAQLAKALKISKPTISVNTEKLLEQHILIETGEGSSSGGRKPTLLNFNYDYKLIVAIDLNRNHPLIALSNLKGELKYTTIFNMDVEESKPLLIQKLTTSINELITSHDYALTELGAITIAIPAVIDDVTDTIFANPHNNLWTDLNLKKILKAIYHVPVMMKNDISMAAVGVKHFGEANGYNDLMYVSSGRGVGAGIILNGQLLEGKRKFAGEIGFTRLNSQRTLEETIGTSYLLQHVKESIDNGQETSLKNISLESLKTALLEGDKFLNDLMVESGELLGRAISNIVSILDLEYVVLGGTLTDISDVFSNTVKETVKAYVPFDIEVKNSSLGREAGILGLLYVGKTSILSEILK